MPRVNLTQADREKAEQARREESFRRTVSVAMATCGIKTNTKLAELMGISRQCLYARLKLPRRFTWAETCRLVKLLNIPNESVLRMMGVTP